ncbi:MAG: hypothetical protein HY831_03510 [Candidatus Aenigmarchaeota archaeon]|nr:hypothetical protein [Candidatus Aenigmarchaeota archaeon]
MNVTYAPLSRIIERIKSEKPPVTKVLEICREEYGIKDSTPNNGVQREAEQVATVILYKGSPLGLYNLSLGRISALLGRKYHYAGHRYAEGIYGISRVYQAFDLPERFEERLENSDDLGKISNEIWKKIRLGILEYCFQQKRTPQEVLEQICFVFNETYGDSIKVKDLSSKERKGNIPTARLLGYYFLREGLEMEYPEIGKFLNKDRTTVGNGYRKIENIFNKIPSDTENISTLERIPSEAFESILSTSEDMIFTTIEKLLKDLTEKYAGASTEDIKIFLKYRPLIGDVLQRRLLE